MVSVPLHFLSSLPEPETSLGDLLSQHVPRHVSTLLDCIPSTSQPAIYSADWTRSPLTHATLHAFLSTFVLPTAFPLGQNDRVMLVLPTGPTNALALLAIASYHTCAPVNATCTAAELFEDAARLGAKTIVATRDAEDRLELRNLKERLGCEVVYVEERTQGEVGLFDMIPLGNTSLPQRRPSHLHSLSDQSLVLHTSGTSGKKKVVPYTLQSLLVGTCAVIKSWAIGPNDVNMNMMPLFHVGGIVRNLFAPIMSGGSVIVCPAFDAEAFWPLAHQLGATWYYAAPTMHHAILAARPEGVVPSRDTRIRMVCNAAGGLLPSLAIQLRDIFGGAAVLPSYGMTECMPIASPPPNYTLDRPGTSGRACGPFLSIRDPRDISLSLPSGGVGAVCVRGAPMFDGYEVVDEKGVRRCDRSVFSSEGWFDTGDVGYMDADGWLYITGRSKEIINKGGEVVSPLEVEEAVMTVASHRVHATLAFAVPHDVLQETVGLVIVPAPGATRIGIASLHALLRDRLHPSKWPFALVYMDDLPKNATGKPLRIGLATRLGLGTLSEHDPPSRRYFAVEVAINQGNSLPASVPCVRITPDAIEAERTLGQIKGVREAVVRARGDGALEAFASVEDDQINNEKDLRATLEIVLPDYNVPERVHVFASSLPYASPGIIDFTALELLVSQRVGVSLSPRALVVRNTFANVLSLPPASIGPDADFFLLGGNSLLLGRLAYMLRRETGVRVPVQGLFARCTVAGVAGLIEETERGVPEEEDDETVKSEGGYEEENSEETLWDDKKEGWDAGSGTLGSTDGAGKSRGQYHPLVLIVQTIPLLFHPLKAALTWAMLLWVLSALTRFVSESFWQRSLSLLLAILVARITARIICPVSAILFKWVVIGTYVPGEYRMWSTYHLRWWIVNQALRSAGRGIFGMHPALELIYYRLLGAHIGRDVQIVPGATLAEYDLLTLGDGCRIDRALVRGFCVERDGHFRLGRIVVGRRAVVNTYTQIAPGAIIPDAAVFGPHASSHEPPSPRAYANCNRTVVQEPGFLWKLFIAWPIIAFVIFVSYIPWFTAIWLMLHETILQRPKLNAMESVIWWFANPNRVAWHAIARVIRAVFTPLVQLALGIIVKRLLGFNVEGTVGDASQRVLLRRYVNGVLLSQIALKRAFDVIGTHYEATSMVWRAMGAKVGKRVYWPGSSVSCPDPELLEVGDDVVFGSRSEFFTTDRIGSKKIVIGAGAMVADRCVLLPGVKVGKKTVLGSGSLAKRGGIYPDGSMWMGQARGRAIRLNSGSRDVKIDGETITPFGRAFYERKANYFVLPYSFLLFVHVLTTAVCAAYWSIGAVATAQILRQLRIHTGPRLFLPTWYRFGTIYGLIAACFVVVLNLQVLLSLLWVVMTKWALMGRRKEGSYHWDKSSYCQRWQLHITLSRPIYAGYGIGGVLSPLTGTVYIVWYLRALGAKIGKNCAIFASGKVGLMTEPDLVTLGDDVSLDDCSVVAHINSRGEFALNALKIGNGCALRSGSRLLSGASMEDSSMLLEHTLLPSGDIAESGTVHVGWPGHAQTWDSDEHKLSMGSQIICPLCRRFPKGSVVTTCGHLFCHSCISKAYEESKQCPVCSAGASPDSPLSPVYLSFK